MRSSDAAGSVGGVGVDLTGVDLTAVGLAFLGDAPRRGAFFVACLLIVLVFPAVVVFLRVDALTAAFLRLCLGFPCGFFSRCHYSLPKPPPGYPWSNRCPITKQVNGQGGARYCSQMLRGFGKVARTRCLHSLSLTT
jgi:hypothetical protein